MTLFQLRYAILWTAMAMCSGAARADLYGYVDGDRVSVIIADTQPADGRYRLFRKDPPGPASEPAAHMLAAIEI